MQIYIKDFRGLPDKAPGFLKVSSGAKISDVILKLGLEKDKKYFMVLLNKAPASREDPVGEGDEITLIPYLNGG